jgi:DNA-binding transcriptional LysR family regulator
MPIDFLGIEAFLAGAECGSFGLAAERLHLSQSAISHRMRKLEESLGVRLMVRTTRGVVLTQAGDALLPRARAALLQLEASCDTVRAHGRPMGQRVAFSCLPTLAATALVPLLQRYAPVSSLAYFDLLVLTGANSPHKDLQGVVAEGERRMVNIGTINPGSTQHLSGELFKTVAGIQATGSAAGRRSGP